MRDLLRRRFVLVLAAVLLLLILSANRIATFLTDLWWFDAIGFRQVFTGILGTRILLGVLAGALLAVIVAVNLTVARRVRPLIVPSTPQQAIVERYRQMVDPWLPWVIGGIAVLFGLTAGFAVSGQWREFLLWRNGVPFGVADPQFSTDVGFYVFSLPWWQFVESWLFTSLLLVTLLTAGAHYLLGGIRPEARGEKVLPSVKVHLSVLLALLLAVRAWGFWLDRFELNFSPRGVVTGASYTDVNAQLPALNLLIAISVVAIALTLYNIRQRGWLLPGAAIAILVIAGIVLSGIYPAVIQQLRVDPQELQRESTYIDRNREATVAAYDLDVGLQRFTIEDDLAPEDVANEQVTLNNIRLWDERVLSTTYDELQALRPYYRFLDVDVDRYVIDDEVRQVVLAARELDPTGFPENQWQIEHLIYTHAFGVVASRVNTADEQGQPVFLAKDIPTQGVSELVPDQEAGIYFGEMDEPAYSIVDTDQEELHFEDPDTGTQEYISYDGEGGVSIGSLMRRAAFALRFADVNFLLSDLLTDDSQVIWDRDVRTRVRKVAPFLTLDPDPYPVVLDGRVLWVQDAYTTTNNYPYSQRLANFLRSGPANYIRNSVKAVVDAYDGTVTLYVVDPEDPVVQAWRNAFPDAFEDISEAPEGLADHFRYPQGMFSAQSQLYRRYHIPTTAAFYNQGDLWDIPRDASEVANNAQLQALPTEQQPALNPYYLLMRLPGQETEEFVLIQPYLANNKPNMIAWLAARSDPEHYGELYAVQFPSTTTVLGPQQAQSRIEQESEISQFITLRSQEGSEVVRGNLLVIPVGQSILYVEPLFIRGQQSDIPELSQVVIVMGTQVVMEPTLAEAIEALVGEAPPGTQPPPDGEEPGGEQPGGEVPDQERIDQLLQQMNDAFESAQEALQQGNLGLYQTRLGEAQRLLVQILELRGLVVQPEPSPTPSPGASPTPSPEASPNAGEGGGTS